MKNPSILALIRPILTNRFGPLVAHIASVLSSKGSLSLSALLVHTDLPLKVIKECLVILIHHSFVTWRLPKTESESVLYFLIIENVIFSSLIPWLLEHIQESKGNEMMVALTKCFVDGCCLNPTNSLISLGILEESFFSIHHNQNEDDINIENDRKKVKLEKSNRLYRPSYKLIQLFYQREVLAHVSSRLMNDNRYVFAVRALFDAKNLALIDMGNCVPGLSGMEAKNLLDSLYWKVEWIDRSSTPHLTFSCNMNKVKRFLAEKLLSSFIVSRWSGPSLRLINILRSKGFLQDRTLSALALMPLKEIRERMYLLLTEGIVHMQEVPKSADHAPNRTTYLWALNEPHKCWPALGMKAAAGMVKQLQVMQTRKDSCKLLLDKLNRKDVDESMLSAMDKSVLEKYYTDQAASHAQFMRLLTDLLILCYF